MRSIICAMVGIATLVCGVIGSVATAHDDGDHKHEYFMSGLKKRTGNIVLFAVTGGQAGSAEIEVTDRNGNLVTPKYTLDLTHGGHPLLLRVVDTKIIGDVSIGDVYRTIRITATEKLWVWASRNTPAGRFIIPVHYRAVPNDDTTDDDDTTPAPTEKDNTPDGPKD